MKRELEDPDPAGLCRPAGGGGSSGSRRRGGGGSDCPGGGAGLLAAGAVPVRRRRETCWPGRAVLLLCRPAPAASGPAKGTGEDSAGRTACCPVGLLGTAGPALRSGQPGLDGLAPRRRLGAGGLGVGLWDGSGRLGDPPGPPGTGRVEPWKSCPGCCGYCCSSAPPCWCSPPPPGGAGTCLDLWDQGDVGRRPAVGGDGAGLCGDVP